MRYVFSFDVNEAQLILDALVKLPYHQVAPLIANIHEQVRNQPKEPRQIAEEPQDGGDAM